MEELTTYDSLDEALMETFPASDPIAVDHIVAGVEPPAPEAGRSSS